MASLKIATWNVNSLRVRIPHLVPWIEDTAPDVIALQETKLLDEDFPLLDITQLGYSAIYSGQKSYNGVAILSRETMTDTVSSLPGFEDEQKRILATTVGDIRILNVYIPNGQTTSSPKFQYKLRWLAHLKEFITAELQKYPKLMVMGDFNIAPEEIDVHDPVRWMGNVLFTDVERQTFRQILNVGLQDYFRTLNAKEQGFTWWDYRMNAFKRNLGMRIDHVLTSHALATNYHRCYVDATPRTWERPSDHAPVVAELQY